MEVTDVMKQNYDFLDEENIEDECGNEPIDDEPVVFSKNTKRRMNRIFREIAGIKKIPYPEVDNLFERVRSWLKVKFSKKK